MNRFSYYPVPIQTRPSNEKRSGPAENAIKTSGANRMKNTGCYTTRYIEDAVATAQQAGTPEAAQIIYEINLATAENETEFEG